MRTVILLVLTTACALSANDSQIDRRVREAVATMQEPPTPGVAGSPVERAVAALLAAGALEPRGAEVVRQFEQAFAILGRPTGYAEVGVRRYGARAEIAYFVLTCAKGVGFVRVVSLKAADNNRVISDLMVATRPDGLLPPSLLEPEILRPQGQ